MNRLRRIFAADTVKNYAQGEIVLVPSKNAKFQAKYLNDLKNPKIKITIAIANPETAPYGKAAKGSIELLQVFGKRSKINMYFQFSCIILVNLICFFLAPITFDL